jgi:hypothetical protein
MLDHILRTRNRVAHHEPLLLNTKHVFTKAGEAKNPHDLALAVGDGITKFLKEVDLTVKTAQCFAPMAAKYIEVVPDKIRAEIAPFRASVEKEQRRLRELSEARKAARKMDP